MRAKIKATFATGQIVELEYSEVGEVDAPRIGLQVVVFLLTGLLEQAAVSVEVTIRPTDSANGSH